MIIFSTEHHGYLEQELAELTGAARGELVRRRFPDGESYHRIQSDVDDRHVVLVGGGTSDADWLELYDVACGLVQEGAATLTLVVPYLGYSTMDRAVRAGEVVKAKTRARLLSAIPIAQRGNRIVLVDLHVEGLTHYFEGLAHPVHLHARDLVLAAVRDLGGDDFVLACTDAGRAKWVESLAYELGVTASFVFKRRGDDGTPRVTAVSAQVQGKRVVLYDDMIRTGSSLVNAARAYRDAGATDLWAVTTHGLFPGRALEDLEETGLFRRIVCTNSHPRAVELCALHPSLLEVRSVAPLIAERLRGWTAQRSLTPSPGV